MNSHLLNNIRFTYRHSKVIVITKDNANINILNNKRLACSSCLVNLNTCQNKFYKTNFTLFLSRSKFSKNVSKTSTTTRVNNLYNIASMSISTVPAQEIIQNSENIEGPIVHHAHQAAVVITANNKFINKTISDNKIDEISSQSIVKKDEMFVLNDEHELLYSKELISHTKAYVRKLSESEQGEENLDKDVEYVVESDNVKRTKLIGALPPGALDWRPVGVDASKLPSIYASLAKSRLTGLVVASALGGYILCPLPLAYSNLFGVIVGTALISSAANTTNQILETPYDAQMMRTSNRVLVRGKITPLHAAMFAGVCGASGVALLNFACNPLTAGLGFANLILYTSVYTPMKRATIANTWMGAVVGAIPPLMGWCGCSGTLMGPDACGAWLMTGLLFAWQFPHFNALSWNLRPDYSKAGYRMMCVINPRLCKVTCLRYSGMLLAIGFAAPAMGVTTWTFAIDSTPLNAYMLYLSYKFYKDGDSKSSRNLFRFSLIHLPAVIVLMIISKKYSPGQSENESKDRFTDHYLSKINVDRPLPQTNLTSLSLGSENTNVAIR